MLVFAFQLRKICLLLLLFVLFAIGVLAQGAEYRTPVSDLGYDILSYAKSGRAPIVTLTLYDRPPGLLAPHTGLECSTALEQPAMFGPHMALSPSPEALHGRFMVVRKPHQWMSASAFAGQPPLRYTSETLETKLASLGLSDIYHLDEAYFIAYIPSYAVHRPTGRLVESRGLLDLMLGSNHTVASVSSSRTVPVPTVLTAIDVFARTGRGYRFKLSLDLRRAMDEGTGGEEARLSFLQSLLETTTSGHRRLGVAVWTRAGASHLLQDELQRSATLRVYNSCSVLPPGTGVSSEAPKSADDQESEQPCCAIHTRAVTCGINCPDHVVVTLLFSERTKSESGLLATRCLRALESVATHPLVRWLEVLPSGADAANIKGASFVQNNSANPSVALRGTPEWSLAHPLWAAGIDGTGEVVAIVDSGVDVDSCFFHDERHPDIAYYPRTSGAHRKIISYLSASCQKGSVTDATDHVYGHGTHVAGSAVGCSEANQEMSKYNGVAPGAKLFVHDLGCPDSLKLQLPSNFRDVFTPSYTVGSRITCNSWGVEGTPAYSAMERLVDSYLYEHDDMLAIFAVGNEPQTGPTRPGRTKNVLTVGSHSNDAGLLQSHVSAFSAHGPTYDRRQKPDIVAPGSHVQSASSDGMSGSVQCDVTAKHGTSMAAGFVAGGAALVRQYFRQSKGLDSPSAALMKATLIHFTHFLSAAPVYSGFGRVDLSLLLQAETAPTWPVGRATPVADPSHPHRLWLRDRKRVAHLDTQSFCFSANADYSAASSWTGYGSASRSGLQKEPATVKATLVWTDVGTAAEGAHRSLVHDLDLILVDMYGTMYYSNNRANPKHRHFDRDNNVEQIELPYTTELSHFRVFVHAASVLTQPTQQYALIVTAPSLIFFTSCSSRPAPVWQRAALPSHTICPGNCSAPHGHCNLETGLCECLPHYQFIDCSQCNAHAVCGGHGSCDDDTLECTCDPLGHFESKSNCRLCQHGWAGENCDFDCMCTNGGVCDTAAGVCQCPQDTTIGGAGCFQGPRCEYCCDGFGGDRCKEKSYWCDESGAVVEIDDPREALIQVNGFARYDTSLICRWRLVAPPGHYVSIDVLSMDLEAEYDYLNVYDTLFSSSGNQSHLAQRYTHSSMEPSTVTSTGRAVDLVFVSDWEGTASGFQLRYHFVSMDPNEAACAVQCTGVPSDDTAVSSSTAQRQTCGSQIGLDNHCICQTGFMGFNCEYAINTVWAGNPPHQTATEGASTSTHSEHLVPLDSTLVAHATFFVEGTINGTESSSHTAERAVLVARPDTLARLPVGVNAPSQLNVSITLSDALPSAFESVRGDHIRVHIQFQPVGACGDWREAHLTDLFGLSLAAYVDDTGKTHNTHPAQTLSLYHCDMETAIPTLPIVLKRLQGRRTPAEGGSTRLTFQTHVSVMILWNASSKLPEDFTSETSVCDVAVSVGAVHWLPSGSFDAQAIQNSTNAMLRPWVCDSSSSQLLTSFSALVVPKTQPPAQAHETVIQRAHVSIRWVLVTCAFGMASGALLTLSALRMIKQLSPRRTPLARKSSLTDGDASLIEQPSKQLPQ